ETGSGGDRGRVARRHHAETARRVVIDELGIGRAARRTGYVEEVRRDHVDGGAVAGGELCRSARRDFEEAVDAQGAGGRADTGGRERESAGVEPGQAGGGQRGVERATAND